MNSSDTKLPDVPPKTLHVPKLSQSQITTILTHFSSMTHDIFMRDFEPYIDNYDHFRLTLSIYRNNPKMTWEEAARIAKVKS